MDQVQINHLARNPMAAMRFHATGQLPAVMTPDSPLIRLLEKMSPRDRAAITGLTVGPLLGYAGNRMFATAEQALRWCKPASEIIASQSFPAESWRLKHFSRTLYLDELLFNAAKAPDSIRQRYKQLCRAELSPAQTPEPQEEVDSTHPAP